MQKIFSRLLFLLSIAICHHFTALSQAVKTTPLRTPPHLKMKFEGVVGQRLHANLENWELSAPAANPAMVEMFYDRDRKPSRNLLPWSGEFIGKYVCSAILSYRILHDPRQKKLIGQLIDKFISSQGADGYLGPFDRASRLTGANWDIWGHYWAIRALLLYHEEFNSPRALDAAQKAADMLVSHFLNKDFHFTNDGNGASNYAVIHAFTQLYLLTGHSPYLDMAKWIVKEWDLPGSNQYLSKALAGYEMYQFANNGNRWESIHDILGIYDLYLITGEQQYYDAFTKIWQGIQKGDRHNTGGFTSGEAATGNPYHPGPIETCCTVAWIDMSVDELKLTANPLVADELELTTYNGLLGGEHVSGRWWTYNTPMDGAREASAHTINFQCRPGSPELNCCSVNGPRGLALLSEWAVLRSQTGVALNFYGQSSFQLLTPGSRELTITENTDYPSSGKVTIQISLPSPETFLLQLRIPSWSAVTKVKVNGQAVDSVTAGSYLSLTRQWKPADRIEILFDMTPHYWAGEKELAEKTSVYYGPLLLAFDPVYNTMDPDKIPALDAADLTLTPAVTDRPLKPWVLFSLNTPDGNTLHLCDFATAGAYGNTYVSWLTVKGIGKMSYDPRIPVWTNRNLIHH